MKRFDVLTIGLQVIDLMIPGMDGHIPDREMTLLDHAELTRSIRRSSSRSSAHGQP